MKKISMVHRLSPVLLMFITLFFISSCRKSMQDEMYNHSNNLNENAREGSYNQKKAAVAIDWYDMQLRTILAANPAYPNGIPIRAFAYTGISLYEVVRNADHESPSLSRFLYQMPPMPGIDKRKEYSFELAANASMAFMTRKLFPNINPIQMLALDSLETAYNNRLGKKISTAVYNRSREYGLKVADSILKWAASDKSNLANAPYTPPSFPGAWIPALPLFALAATPYMGNVRPFLENDKMGVADPPLFAFSTDPSSEFYKMVKDVYDVSKTLTTDQTNMALFWNDLGAGKGYTPPGHGISVLNQVLRKENVSLSKAVEAYAKAGMGTWDGTIKVFRSKYAYNLLRPVTYIRSYIDPAWLPLIPTPPHPEYPAAHAYITSATMLAIAGALGDKHTFTDDTYHALGYPARHFTSLSAVGIESGMSRRYGGIHYLPSIKTGIADGQAVGRAIGKIKIGED